MSTSLIRLPDSTADVPAWKWTKKKRAALQMLLAGIPKTQIANDLGKHRNTISAWCSHPEFLREAQKKHHDHVVTTRQRRGRETTIMADKLSKITMESIDRLAKNPDDRDKRAAAKDFAALYQAFRESERIDFGDNVTKHEHRVATVSLFGTMPGQIPKETVHTSEMDFGAFMERAVKHGVIDAELLDTTDIGSLLTSMAQQVMIEGELLDVINEEDTAAEESSKKR